jgi:hypothetical protein
MVHGSIYLSHCQCANLSVSGFNKEKGVSNPFAEDRQRRLRLIKGLGKTLLLIGNYLSGKLY